MRTSGEPGPARPSRFCHRWARRVAAGVVACGAALVAAAAEAPRPAGVRDGPLHVPSPDWRDQVIYFLMTDRFADGDPTNNDQGAGEADRRNPNHFQGGDLRGVRERLDYIQGLGATAVWITPPVANQWLDPQTGHAGYHGYWAEHFKRVDRHLGTLADLRALSRALHGRGMYLVQDIVLNHTGNFFAYGPRWDPQDPARDYRPIPGVRPARPTQPPFHLNDPRRAADRRAGIYHWTPDVADFNDPDQLLRYQMSGLDDLATDRAVVRRALRDSHGWWIRQAGVDAMRVDTAFYVAPHDMADILYAKDPKAPGLAEVARRTGRRDFLVFGEGFGIDRPYDDTWARRIEAYMRAPDGRARLPGMLNFPLYGTLNDVLVRGQPTAELGWRIERMMALHARPHLMPSFVDNHDVDRFLSGGSVPALEQSLLAIFTLPGIPTVYYGTEQGYTKVRASMFAAGHGSGGRDRFDTAHPLYRWIAALSALRRGDPVFTRGTPQVLRSSAAGAGALAWRMTLPGRPAAFVLLNTADHPVLLDKAPTGLAAGAALRGLLGRGGTPPVQHVDARGDLTVVLPPRAAWVLQAEPAGGAVPAAAPATDAVPVLAAVPERVTEDLPVSGQWTPTTGAAPRTLRLVIDGDVDRATPVMVGPDGRFAASIDTSALVDPSVTHELVAWDPATGAVSATARFRVERRWTLAADIADPADDDRGPDGRYRYPTDPSFATQRSADLRRVQARVSGGSLELALTMAGLARSWNPPNGFDHLALTIYIELPGQASPGARQMPLQVGELPEGMRWHRRLRVHGWSNALHAHEQASATVEGTPLTPAARLSVDAATSTIRLLLPASSLGGLRSLSGARIWVTTWDYDSGYRAIAPEPGPFVFGGGDPRTAPRVMDASPVIVLP